MICKTPSRGVAQNIDGPTLILCGNHYAVLLLGLQQRRKVLFSLNNTFIYFCSSVPDLQPVVSWSLRPSHKLELDEANDNFLRSCFRL